jgi:hypothetical protein
VAAPCSPLRDLILDDHDRVPDLDLGVGEGAAGAGEAHSLGRPEHRRVELEGLDAALHHQAGRDAAIGVRDLLGLGRGCHLASLLAGMYVGMGHALLLQRLDRGHLES